MGHKRRIIKNNIKYARQRKHLSQAELAERCGVTRETVSYWENMHKAPSDQHKALLCEALDCDINYLFDWR